MSCHTGCSEASCNSKICDVSRDMLKVAQAFFAIILALTAYPSFMIMAAELAGALPIQRPVMS